MSRKRNRPATPAQDVRTMGTRSQIELLFEQEKARLNAAWLKVLSDPTMPPNRAQSILAGDLPYFSAPPVSGPGRRRDAALERAARLYVAAVETKDAMRAAGYGDLMPDHDARPEDTRRSTLETVAKMEIPGFDALSEDRRAVLLGKIHDAVKHRRKKDRKKAR